MDVFFDLDGDLNLVAKTNGETLLLRRWYEDYTKSLTHANLTWKTEPGPDGETETKYIYNKPTS